MERKLRKTKCQNRILNPAQQNVEQEFLIRKAFRPS